jgi:hypothetical protein
MRINSGVAFVVAAMLVVGLLGGGAALGEKKGKSGVYKAPYRNGPQGGDEFNFISRDRQSGTIRVMRLFPGIPPVVGCEPEPSAGWSMFQVTHRVKKPVRKVTADISAMLDPYAWVTVGARKASGPWLGVKKFQGPFQGSRKVTARLFKRPDRGDRIVLEFGLQLGDACPQVGAGEVEFSSVRVETK